ncbi:unnamed protein product [Rhizoctonia solani]|uniref:Survival protein SurE-like phosphatase/nucleotidase domain-containing protein n=1 Tax=Rhizoctonia solani TaxID=456999 RepID=A0A8H3GIX3_9AGAM|nr:unnamed protein product [Rhizoctonia solani]
MNGCPIRVLLTNDDDPPARDSPYVLSLYLELKKFGWDVRVVLPASQKSWIGKAHAIHDAVYGYYFYPKGDGTGERRDVPRLLEDGEVGEWILLDGTPATCTNIALHNLYPGEIDLVVSGPNFGVNTGTAFVLSSGTIGAAMSGALSQVRSIALSYGNPRGKSLPEYIAPTQALAGRIIKRLWENWGTDKRGLRQNEVDLYSVNIPLTSQLLRPDGMEVCWTTLRSNSYGQLFRRQQGDIGMDHAESDTVLSATTNSNQPNMSLDNQLQPRSEPHLQRSKLAFTFVYSPDMRNLAHPPLDGTDTWAIINGRASVTPMCAAFCSGGDAEIVAGTTWGW